jgi:hypothetical protein
LKARWVAANAASWPSTSSLIQMVRVSVWFIEKHTITDS